MFTPPPKILLCLLSMSLLFYTENYTSDENKLPKWNALDFTKKLRIL